MSDTSSDGGRRLQNLENSMNNTLARLGVLEVKASADEVRKDNIEKRLDGIEGTLQWLVRLIISALIMAAVGFALGGGFVNV
jgi:hypothetical protein